MDNDRLYDTVTALLAQGLETEQIIDQAVSLTGKSRETAESTLSIARMAASHVARPAPEPVEAPPPPAPKPKTRPDGLPVGTVELTDLKLPHDTPHILVPVQLVRDMAALFWQRERGLAPACFDVLLCCFLLWNRQGCKICGSSFLIQASLAEMSRALGNKRYGGWQLRWLQQQLDRLQAAGLLSWQKQKHGRRSILIRMSAELSPTRMRDLKPFDLAAYRSLRAPTAKYVYVRAGYQVSRNGSGELGGDTLAQALNAQWAPSREKSRLEMVAAVLDSLPLYQDCTVRVAVQPKVDGSGLKLVFKAVGKAIAIKIAEVEARRKPTTNDRKSQPTSVKDIIQGLAALA